MKILDGTYAYKLPFGLYLCIDVKKDLLLKSWFSDQAVFLDSPPPPLKTFLDGYYNGLWQPDLYFHLIPWSSFKDKRAAVYRCLINVTTGTTVTYGELARYTGCASREVGTYMRTNPLPLFIPCHRVVGEKSLGGFTPNVEWKKMILDWESAQCKKL
ncbi:methylated-DNA--[protein]-cysteine S-methyltransferase [Coprothermobacter platensis]|uniref:methylated-DNA--[protein]-cysteine S-methyltransferase n=1 Tax=Coprothermobacter platensis TaxID=108819 RepID=UPI000376E42D|nr:MGMT family protein [Coprothermobacter platensis]